MNVINPPRAFDVGWRAVQTGDGVLAFQIVHGDDAVGEADDHAALPVRPQGRGAFHDEVIFPIELVGAVESLHVVGLVRDHAFTVAQGKHLCSEEREGWRDRLQ